MGQIVRACSEFESVVFECSQAGQHTVESLCLPCGKHAVCGAWALPVHCNATHKFKFKPPLDAFVVGCGLYSIH
jgi:hypothetical protein